MQFNKTIFECRGEKWYSIRRLSVTKYENNKCIKVLNEFIII